MIYIFGQKNSLLQKLFDDFGTHHISADYVKDKHVQVFEKLYSVKDQSIHAIIAEDSVKDVNGNMWIDLLEGLARRVPVVVLHNGDMKTLPLLNQTNSLTWLQNPGEEEVLNFLRSCGAIGSTKNALYRNNIPVYSPLVATRLLRGHGFLSVISIHARDFTKVSLEYGNQVYKVLQRTLQKIMYEMWGSSGAFRHTDILCRRSLSSNTFYILLERSRTENYMPVPGDLEKLAERLSLHLENLMWRELTTASNERILPKFLELVPRFIVSYASALYNPCIDPFTTVDQLLRSCRDTAKVQDARMLNRQQELIQTLIQAENLLTCHFQAVVDLRYLSPQELATIEETRCLDQFPESLHAFEALARINKADLQKVVGEDMSMNVDYLNPGVLFSRAEEVNLKLELDQACFRLAMKNFKNVPGKLFVNILPRNFYFLDDLKHAIPDGIEAVFEVSETEAISNMNLIQSIREKLSRHHAGIAIDDFGKGYAGVDRIIKIQPTVIKLDQILISQIDQDVRMQAFIHGLVEAARSTQSLVLAEGVETKEELITLHKIGIDLAQGYYLHKPESIEDVRLRLGKRQKVKSA